MRKCLRVGSRPTILPRVDCLSDAADQEGSRLVAAANFFGAGEMRPAGRHPPHHSGPGKRERTVSGSWPALRSTEIAFQNITLECDGCRFTVSGSFDVDEAGAVNRICIGSSEQTLELTPHQTGLKRRWFDAFACQLVVAFHPEIVALVCTEERRAA